MITKKHVRIIDFVFAVGTLVFILAGIYFGFYYNSGIMLGPPEPFFVYEENNVHRILVLDENGNLGSIIVPLEGATRLFNEGTYYLDLGKSGAAKFTFEQAVSLKFARVDETHFGIFNSEDAINVKETEYTQFGEFTKEKVFGGRNG